MGEPKAELFAHDASGASLNESDVLHGATLVVERYDGAWKGDVQERSGAPRFHLSIVGHGLVVCGETVLGVRDVLHSTGSYNAYDLHVRWNERKQKNTTYILFPTESAEGLEYFTITHPAAIYTVFLIPVRFGELFLVTCRVLETIVGAIFSQGLVLFTLICLGVQAGRGGKKTNDAPEPLILALLSCELLFDASQLAGVL